MIGQHLGKYEILEEVGQGGMSVVYRGVHAGLSRDVAVKVHEVNPGWSNVKKQSYIRHAMREYRIHQSLDHPHVVRFYDCIEIDHNTFATVLEYCTGTDLDRLLKRHKCLPEREARAVLMQPVKIPRRTFSRLNNAMLFPHSHGLDFHSRALLFALFTTGCARRCCTSTGTS